MSFLRRATPQPPALTHWDVLHWLLQIDPAPAMGDTWLDGFADGIYMAQCHLRGKAQAQATNGSFAAAVETAKAAVALNAQRRLDGGDQ